MIIMVKILKFLTLNLVAPGSAAGDLFREIEAYAPVAPVSAQTGSVSPSVSKKRRR